MAKVKAVVVVVLLVGVGGAGALLGLNGFYQARIASQVQCALAGAEKQFVEHLRVEAFAAIQQLSRENRNPELLAPLSRLRPFTAGTSAEAMKSAMKSSHDSLVPLIEAIKKRTKSGLLFILSSDGRVVAKLPDKENFSESIKGLPAVSECLGGTYRDGIYEINGAPHAVAVAPVQDARGDVAGCLMSAKLLDTGSLSALAEEVGLGAAIFLRGKVIAATLESNVLKPLISKLDSSDIVRFGDPATGSPLFADFSGSGYAARTVKLEGGTDSLHLAVILPLEDLITPLKEAQTTLFMGIGALLIIGLLLGFLLSAKSDIREAMRLRDAVRNLSNGGTSALNVTGYSGIYEELAQSISQLTSAGSRPVPAMSAPSSPGFESEPPEAPEPSTLDFESLLGSAGRSPAPAEPAPEEPEAELQELEPVPAEPPPGPELPSELFASAAEPPEPIPPSPAPAPVAPPRSGPKVELPGELAGMFDDDTAETIPTAPPDPPSIPPLPGEEPKRMNQITSADYRPDATVIAQVPDELLRAAFTAEQATEEAPSAFTPPSAATPIRQIEESPEDAHFREVFEQFVETKKQCGESTAGLTLDRFSEKLRKNTADLQARYKCRTVKFHVYVKNGKAALKATPLK